ncbi:MAG TPA: imidazoleglycerol-phosphate dehydratase HisB [Desulfotomaculum sp.]|nr:MAG: Imidazoleglycerol-phosphate dehydratase [Desulfotomaculum sp. 46_80]KUK84963.1 MAG: Imidazoleglycerol-phosphate dehydratase [Desulfofundulus kuznetsovii]HBY03913.1 imidazoleglycerol-phosphate dehydratase HisB [Desulfotomaculum sp.]
MAKERTAGISRKTNETDIKVLISLDGKGECSVHTGIGFFEHMLRLWTRHACFDLELTGKGDLFVDAHHTVEDIGICLGQAIKDALGGKAGIARFGQAIVPMDEALVMTAIDISGRGFLVFEVNFPSPRIGDFDTELVEEFFRALAVNGGLTLHIRQLSGTNSHHICEAVFKSLGRALRSAVSFDERIKDIPSTKGVIE